MSTKGMSVTTSRELIDSLHVPVLVFHDFDKSGFSIVGTLKRDTRRYMTAGQALEWERKLPSLLAKNKRPTGYALNRAEREILQPRSVRMVRE